MRNNEQGTILIEFVGSFLLFVLLILSILSLVNITTMQARMHYALTQTANTLSMYGYVLNVIGVDDFMMKSNEVAENVRQGANDVIGDINDVLDNVNNLDIPGVVNSAGTATSNIGGQIGNALDNPTQAIQSIANYALNELGSAAFEQLLRPLVAYHLSNGDMSGDEYLWSVGVNGMDGLEFYSFTLPEYIPAGEGELVGSITEIADNDSALLNSGGNVKITVQYEMAYSFMGLDNLLPFEPKLKVTQSVMTKMWLGGRGKRYEK
jgi:hypothetical protein